ncbi:MAG: hypothetical protein EA382_14300 [Spirochaetaceae bacterium]|nr:MAG: hypothetical protein EA382_14300 [Spirochaetaceae bacterium]
MSSPGFVSTAWRLFWIEVSVQSRAGLYAAYGAMTAFFFALLALVPQAYRQATFGLIVLLDPSFMGFFFAGGLVLLERDQGVLSIILTNSRGFAAYWRAKASAILALAVLVVGVLTALSALLGFVAFDAAGLLRLAVGLVLTVPVYLSLGIVMASWFPRVIDYFIYSTVIMMPLMFPLVEIFGLTVGPIGVVSPVWGALVLITSVFEQPRSAFELVAAVLALGVWNVVAYRLAASAFVRLGAGRGPRRVRAVRAIPRRRRLPALSADVRLLVRDPMTVIVVFAPFLAAGVLGRGLPWLLGPGGPFATGTPGTAVEALLAWMDNVRSFVLVLTGVMYGMLGAFLILDEKDEGVLPFLHTLPGRPGWFILRRCRTLFVIYLISIGPMIAAGNLVHGDPVVFAASLVVDAFILPVTFLGMGVLAKNKVQGLALAKVLNVCTLPPILIGALPGRWAWLAGVFPTAWGSLMRLSAQGSAQVIAAAAAGFVSCGAITWHLFRKARALGTG